jgi:hypothetical protein
VADAAPASTAHSYVRSKPRNGFLSRTPHVTGPNVHVR